MSERTVQVRVAVAVDRAGEWHASGWYGQEKDDDVLADAVCDLDDTIPPNEFILTATLPIPRPSEPVEVAADVESACEWCGAMVGLRDTHHCQIERDRASAEEGTEYGSARWSVRLMPAELAMLEAGVLPTLIRPDALLEYTPEPASAEEVPE